MVATTTSTISLKICIFLKMFLMISRVIGSCSTMYGSPIIFKYDLDLGKKELSITSNLISLTFLIHFSIIFKSEVLASLPVVLQSQDLRVVVATTSPVTNRSTNK